MPGRSGALFALYRGDTFLDVGTRWELAERHGLKPDSIYWLSTTTAHKRITEQNYNRRLLAYRLDRIYE